MAEGKSGAAHDTVAGWKEFYEPISVYAAAVAAAQQEAQKQVRSAYLAYLDQVRTSYDHPAVREAVRAYGELLKVGLASPTDTAAVAGGSREYSKAAQEAHGSVGSSLQEAGAALNDAIQKASSSITAERRAELEKLLKSLQSELSRLDPAQVDPVSLTLAGHALLLAASLRAYSM